MKLNRKSHNRILAALLAAVMMFQMLPLMVFADDGADEKDTSAAWIGEKGYPTLLDAVKASVSGDTITLGEGSYTLYKAEDHVEQYTANKKLTFVGQGTDKTTWYIGAKVPDPDKDGSEYNGDYSFDGADTVTFQNMTMESGYQDLLGFIRPQNTVVKDCVINGRTSYWGYTSAEFIDTTFNVEGNAYAVWTYSSPKMTFDNCTFNANGKVINVYRVQSQDITINFKNCKVNSKTAGSAWLYKPALNINDSNVNNKITIYIDNSTVEAARDTITCSQVFGFSGKAGNNSGKTDVYLDGQLVWSDGQMRTHAYTDGEKNQAYEISDATEWVEKNNHFERSATKTCQYCKYQVTGNEKGYELQYELDGGTAADNSDYSAKIYTEGEEVTLAEEPTREEYLFAGWQDNAGKQYSAGEKITLTANMRLTAVWSDPNTPDVPDVNPGNITGGEIAAGVIIGGAVVIGGYEIATRIILDRMLPYIPSNRIELAELIWERAGKPEPQNTDLYDDIDEDDTDWQKAARWMVEQELMDDDVDEEKDTENFHPYRMVTKLRVCLTWQKAKDKGLFDNTEAKAE